MCANLKQSLLVELDFDNNICFNNVIIDDDIIKINKSRLTLSSTIEISEICSIQEKLEKYKKDFDISITLDGIVITHK